MVDAGMNWIDYGIVTIIFLVVGGIFYKALKEPIDLMLGWIGRMLGSARDKLSESGGDNGGSTIITYG
jgi:hypothetical protein